MATLIDNRRARHHFLILETWEAGIALSGAEVKAVKGGHGDLTGAYVRVRARVLPSRRQQLIAELVNAYIAPYAKAAPQTGYEPRRSRRLLFHRHELGKLIGTLNAKGLTLVPLSVYTRNHLVKIKIGLARGKSKADKREQIREREVGRAVRQRLLRRR